jgi:hypothetical protein
MRFDTNSATPKLTFKPVRPLEQDEYTAVTERADTTEALAAITMSFTPKLDKQSSGDAESDSVAAAAAAKHAKVDAPEEDAAPEAAAPKVRGKTKAVDVKSVLDNWADDDE